HVPAVWYLERIRRRALGLVLRHHRFWGRLRSGVARHRGGRRWRRQHLWRLRQPARRPARRPRAWHGSKRAGRPTRPPVLAPGLLWRRDPDCRHPGCTAYPSSAAPARSAEGTMKRFQAVFQRLSVWELLLIVLLVAVLINGANQSPYFLDGTSFSLM